MRGSIEFNDFEVRFIRENYQRFTDAEIASRLNELRRRSGKPSVSRWQVSKRRQRLGISKVFGNRTSGRPSSEKRSLRNRRLYNASLYEEGFRSISMGISG